MNTGDDLKNPLGQLGSVPKKTGEQLVKEPFEAAEKVQEQAGTKSATNKLSIINKSGEATPSNNSNLPSSKDTLEVVKKMYEASDSKTKTPSDQTIESVIKENPKKTPQEIQKMAATRQQLLQQQHTTSYYEPTFNPPKKQEEPRPGEKTEEEKQKKQMEEFEFQKKEEEKDSVLSPSAKQGTVEKNPGIAG